MKGSLSGDLRVSPIYAGGILLWRAKLTLARIEKQGERLPAGGCIIFLGSRDYFHGLFALYLPDDKKKYQQGHLIR